MCTFDRRSVMLLLAGMTAPSVLRAQDVQPAPQIPPQVPMQPVSPALPPPAALRPPPPTLSMVPTPIAGNAIDKTKAYFIFFDQAIDQASMRSLRRQLVNLVEAGVAEITISIDSPGGLIDQMLVTYSLIRALPVKINTHAQGFVASAAAILFLAGAERSADRDARFLFHPSQGVAGGIGLANEQQVRDRVTEFAMSNDVLVDIIRDRTNVSAGDLERFSREAVVYTAEQAKAVGVVQTVADLKIPDRDKARILLLD